MISLKLAVSALGLILASGTLDARNPKDMDTGDAQAKVYDRNSIIANLRINVADDTKEIRVTRANLDPEVYTKAYLLKNPVAYEIRPYIRSAVTDAKRVASSETRVECIRYADGREAILVSAEDYRFLKTTFGMTLDELVEKLDRPELVSSSGQKYFTYFPKYWEAAKLSERVKEMGILGKGDDRELMNGTETTTTDDELNAVLFYVNPGNIRQLAELIAKYDQPIPEVKISYSVYQVDMENDARLGADFQAWRNGDGSNIFSLSSRMRDGWNVKANDVASTPATRHSGALTTMGLSPRWNTRYLDFLRAKGVAKAVTSGELTIRNNQTAFIDAITSTMYIKDEAPATKEALTAYVQLNKKFATASTTTSGVNCLQITDNLDRIITVVDKTGAVIPAASPITGTINIIRAKENNVTKYRAVVVSGNLMFSNGSPSVDLAQAVKLTVGATDDNGNAVNVAVPLNFEDDVTVWHDAGRKTDAYGERFALSLSPMVASLATVLNFNIESASTAVGFGDLGEPRMNHLSYAGVLHVPNSGAEFMIGGITKEIRQETTAKVPWLGDIPGLGWLLGSEGGSTKNYQMVTVLNVETATPTSEFDPDLKQKLDRFMKAAEPYPDSKIYLDYGFDQIYLDTDKKTFDPLP